MRTTSVTVLACALVFGTALAYAAGSPKSTPSAHSNTLRDTLTRMEKQLAQAEQQKNKQFFDRALSPEFLMVAYNGLVFTKPELLSKLTYLDVKQYTMKNFKVRPIGRAGALLTYDLDIGHRRRPPCPCTPVRQLGLDPQCRPLAAPLPPGHPGKALTGGASLYFPHG
jgi:hypothetical protein